jgi:hypothetical protein
MPHLVVERVRSLPPCPCVVPDRLPSKRTYVQFALAVEVVEVLAGLVFVVGSVCFLPQYSHDLEAFLLGCFLFVVGSVLYVVICSITLAEAVRYEGVWSAEAAENALYTAGSWVFLVGTFLYWPPEAHYGNIQWFQMHLSLSAYFNTFSTEFEGTVLFIIGSLMFVLAAFVNGLNQRAPFDNVRSRLLTATTSLYMAGGLLFVMGSVAFLPNLGCGEIMEAFGAWLFIVGSVAFVFGGVVSIVRTWTFLGDKEQEPLVGKP